MLESHFRQLEKDREALTLIFTRGAPLLTCFNVLFGEQIRQDFPEVKKLIAKVKPDNIASEKAFLDVGYNKKYEVFEYVVH